jgi:hypothetical protein
MNSNPLEQLALGLLPQRLHFKLLLQFQVFVGHVRSEAAAVVHRLGLLRLLLLVAAEQGCRPLLLLLLLQFWIINSIIWCC